MECPICLFNFDSEDRIPKILTKCGHTVCMKCLGSIYWNDEVGFKCPFCKEEYRDKLEDLPINYLVLNTVSYSQPPPNNSNINREIDEGSRQISSDRCSSQNRPNELNAMIDENTSQSFHDDHSRQGLVNFYCKDHDGRRGDFVCEDEQKVLCSKCILSHPKEHKISLVEDLKLAHKTRLNGLYDETELLKEEMIVLRNHVNCRKEKLVSATQSATETIERKFEELLQWVLKRREELLSKVQRQARELTDSLDKTLSMLYTKKEECSTFLIDIQRLTAGVDKEFDPSEEKRKSNLDGLESHFTELSETFHKIRENYKKHFAKDVTICTIFDPKPLLESLQSYGRIIEFVTDAPSSLSLQEELPNPYSLTPISLTHKTPLTAASSSFIMAKSKLSTQKAVLKNKILYIGNNNKIIYFDTIKQTFDQVTVTFDIVNKEKASTNHNIFKNYGACAYLGHDLLFYSGGGPSNEAWLLDFQSLDKVNAFMLEKMNQKRCWHCVVRTNSELFLLGNNPFVDSF